MSVVAAPPDATPSGRAIEEDIRHRAAVFLNTAAAFAAYGMVDPDAVTSWPILVTAVGSAFSHWRRRHANLPVKWLLAIGMLYVLWLSLNNLVRGVIDPRLSLAQLLMDLQVLNSFDLPRRRNLRVALLVAAILMVVSGTLSRTSGFGLAAIAFTATLVLALFEGYRSEVAAPQASWRQVVGVTVGTIVALAVFSLPFFVIAPRKARTLAGTTLPLSLSIPLPDTLDSHVRAAAGKGGGADAAGQTRRGYSGFSEHLDLNTRMAPSDEVVLRVKCDRPAYWRALAFDVYDGGGWHMRTPDQVTALPGIQQPIRMNLPAGQHGGGRLVQTFYVERDSGNLIFSAWAPREVYFPTAMIWSDAYDGLRAPVTLQKDMYYSVVSEPPGFTRAALAYQRARPLTPELKRYLELPTTSPRLQALVKQLAPKAATPYTVMDQLETYLATSLRYRLDVPAAPPGAEWVDHFVFEQKEGFCEQFATALAVMGRMKGVPTRLVTGYAPGEYNPFTGYYDVRAKDAHAWVEAWIPNQGWVAFDATPGSLVALEDTDDDGHAREVAHALWALVAPLFDGRPWAIAAGVLAVLALAALGWRAVRRWSPARRRSTAIYRRLRRKLARRGVPALPAQTPRAWLEAASGVGALAPALETLERFVARYEAVRFGGAADREVTDAPELARLARDVERALATRR